MALLDEYNNSMDPDFRTKLIMAVAHKAATELGNVNPGDANNVYERYTMMCRKVLFEPQDAMTFLARIAAQAGLSNSSTDAQIQTAVDGAFDKISKVFDPTVTQ